MTFRTRLLAGVLIIGLAPLVLLAVVIPREMTRRLTGQYREAVAERGERVRSMLAVESNSVRAKLGEVARGLREENQVRSALVSRSGNRKDLLDYSERSLLRTGLALLQIQNDSGRIVSSGHFRNDFDRLDTALPLALLARPGGLSVVKARTPGGPLLALARADTAHVGSLSLTLVGGVALDSGYLSTLAGNSHDLSVTMTLDDGAGNRQTIAIDSARASSVSGGVIDSLVLPFVDVTGATASTGSARLTITHSDAALLALRAGVLRWTIATMILAAAAALAAAWWLSRFLSQPLESLAAESVHIDLERGQAAFAGAARDDEIGLLARRLGAMVERLRGGANKLRDAERRATMGELARQVNHDIKNGLTPIRNVVRHLSQVAEENPGALSSLYGDRRQTLESSVEYLDTLARNYARLSPRPAAAVPCDARAVVDAVVQAASTRAGTAHISASASRELPQVLSDATVLRRILDNLVGNALDAVNGGGGEVQLSAVRVENMEIDRVRFVVKDNGPGMSSEELRKVFDDFYTTKPGGTGLGLSVVRRLVADHGGTLRVETEPGRGTRMIVELPAVGTATRHGAAEGGAA